MSICISINNPNMSSVSSILSPDNLVHNQWILDYVPHNLGWRLAAGAVFIPNILFSIMTQNMIEYKTKSRDLGNICANLIGMCPVITMITGNPIWLMPVVGCLVWVAYINIP